MTVWKIFTGRGPSDEVAVEISYLDFSGSLEHHLSTFTPAWLGCVWLDMHISEAYVVEDQAGK